MSDESRSLGSAGQCTAMENLLHGTSSKLTQNHRRGSINLGRGTKNPVNFYPSPFCSCRLVSSGNQCNILLPEQISDTIQMPTHSPGSDEKQIEKEKLKGQRTTVVATLTQGHKPPSCRLASTSLKDALSQ